MPYKCVHCSNVYADASREILEGCSSCKSKFFFYIKEEKLKEMQKRRENEIELSASEKNQIEKDVREIAGIKNEEMPIFLDFESIKILKPGKYLLDLPKLFSAERPRIYQLESGKYVIDLSSKSEKKEI